MLTHTVQSSKVENKKTSIIFHWVPPTSVLCSSEFLFTTPSHFVAYDCASSCSPFLSLTWHILLCLQQTLVVASTSFSSPSLSTSFSVICTYALPLLWGCQSFMFGPRVRGQAKSTKNAVELLHYLYATCISTLRWPSDKRQLKFEGIQQGIRQALREINSFNKLCLPATTKVTFWFKLLVTKVWINICCCFNVNNVNKYSFLIWTRNSISRWTVSRLVRFQWTTQTTLWSNCLASKNRIWKLEMQIPSWSRNNGPTFHSGQDYWGVLYANLVYMWFVDLDSRCDSMYHHESMQSSP